MFFLAWDPKYELGIKSVDDDHKRLVSIIDELLGALSEGKGKDVAGSTIKKLEDYTLFHFRREEFFMKCAKYPDLYQHLLEHKHFVDKMKELKEKSQQNDATVSLDLMKFLKDWLINHIQVTDKKYEQVLKKSGIQ